MSDPRRSEAGALLANRTQNPTVPNITDGDTADVALTADLAFAGAVAVPVDASFQGAPLANLGIVGAWVSNIVTGVVTVRFSALTGNVATAAQLINIQRRN
jgi:hypothetical protein